MSSEEDESDEFPSDEEDSSDDDEYKESLKMEASKLKNKRMAARPSTIVQVSTGPLEIHLQSMKKQLKAHTALINHPPFLDGLMVEVNKISGLVRKIEHCQLDINTVRETIIAKESSSTSLQKSVNSPGTDGSITEKLNHLFKDLEMLRAVIRRIDVHHALDATVLVKVTKLAKNLKALKEYSEKMYTNNMRVIQDELKGEIKSVNSRIQQMDELHIEKFNEVLTRIEKTESNIHDGQKEENNLIAKKVEFLEENLTTDFYTFKELVDVQLEATKKTSMKAFMKASKGFLGSGMQLIAEYTHKRIINSMRKRFIRWRNYDPVGVLHRGRRLISLTKKAHKKMLTRSALFEWKCYHEKQKERELMSSYMSNIIMKWKDVSFPSLSKRFHTWKRYCVFMRFHVSDRKALTNSNPEVLANEKEEKYSNDEYDQLITTLNPSSDIQGSFQLTGLYVDRIYNKINKVYVDLKNNESTTRRVGQRMDVIKTSLLETLDKRCEELDKQHKTHAKSVSSKIKEINITNENTEKENSKRFMASSEEVRRLESSVTDLNLKVDQQAVRLERLFALHQKMLDRIDSIEITQRSHDAAITKVTTDITGISEKSLRNGGEIMLHKQLTESSIAAIKEDIKDMTYASKDCSEKLQGVLSNQSQGHSAVSAITNDFKHKISNIESWLNTTAPKPPSPKLLVSLAIKFEDRAVEKHCKDPAHLFSVSMSTELAKDIATCAHWLVHHIVEATDVDVLTRIMKGPQEVATVFDQTDPINSLDPITPHDTSGGGSNKHTKASHLTHEEFCTTTRESMLLRYLEKFQKQLRQSRDDVGVIRKEARSLFLKRFIDALDLCLQKHDVIVLNTASAMGRNPGHVTGRPTNDSNGPAACVACDRPLRMRTTSRSIGELYERVLLSGKKSSELKREVLRNQIVSPSNRPSSPVHNYRLEGGVKHNGAEKIMPSYSEDNFESRVMTHNSNNNFDNSNNNHNYNSHSSDFHPADGMGTGRPGGQSVVRIRSASSSSRPQSAPRQFPSNSQSATQLTTTTKNDPFKKVPHVNSPSKGGGFKTSKSSSQEKLAVDIANSLPVETSIPLRHSIDHLPSTTRKLLGKFEGHNDNGDEEGNEKGERKGEGKSLTAGHGDSLQKSHAGSVVLPLGGGMDEVTSVRSIDLIQVYTNGRNGLNGSFIPSSVSALPTTFDDEVMSDESTGA